MAVTSICKTRSVVAEWTPTTHKYVVTYLATVNSPNDGPQVVLSSPLTPRIGTTTYQYGNDIEVDSICVSLSSPRRAGQNKAELKWVFDATFEWDFNQRPEYIPVKIEPYYVGGQEVVDKALFKGFYGPTSSTLDTFIEKGISNTNLTKDQTVGPISNSVPTPIIPAPEREKATPGYRVSWFKKTYSDLGGFINRVNSQEYTLIGLDTNLLTQVFIKSFAAGTLRLRDVQSPITEFYGRNWFHYTLEFVEDTADIYELDRGIAARAKAGDPDGKGGTYTSGDIFTGQSKTRQMLDPGGSPITDPVLFDGNGQPLSDPKPSDAVYLRWGFYPTINFNNLPIGNIT